MLPFSIACQKLVKLFLDRSSVAGITHSGTVAVMVLQIEEMTIGLSSMRNLQQLTHNLRLSYFTLNEFVDCILIMKLTASVCLLFSSVCIL